MQHFRVHDLKTTRVVLHLASAQITRRLNNLHLRPGTTEIEIIGITPDAIEQSFRAEASGNVLVTDTTVDLISNPEQLNDNQLSDHDGTAAVEEADDAGRPTVPVAIEQMTTKLQEIDSNISLADDFIASLRIQHDFLDSYCKSINAQHGCSNIQLTDALDLYQTRRASLAASQLAKKHEVAKLRKERAGVLQKRDELQQQHHELCRRWEREQREDPARLHAKQLIDDRQRLKREQWSERRKFWPSRVHRVVLTLEVPIDTPSSSRRSSFTSQTSTIVQAPPELLSSQTTLTDLTLTYLTSRAYWIPRYDLSVSSVASTASLIYRAELTNATSETWDDTEVVLSTSQASFNGVQDHVPDLEPWHLHIPQPGVDDISRSVIQAPLPPPPLSNKAQISAANGQTMPGSILARRSPSGGLFGSNGNSHDTRKAGQASALPTQTRYGVDPDAHVEPAAKTAALDNVTLNKGRLDLGDAAMDDEVEDQSMSITYNLPHKKTLSPSSKAKRHRITTLDIRRVEMMRTAVPKLRRAVFLQARFTNPSSAITLLGAPAGLTLDGVFLGTARIKRTSPLSDFTVPLGVDPSTSVSYAKPNVKRSEVGGLFAKNEVARSYTRRAVITNTHNVPIKLDVFDQVPLSDDERVKITINRPGGLQAGAGAVKTGRNGKEGVGQSNGSWGSATCKMDAGGKVKWDVTLNKGCACALEIEYDVRSPSGENVVSRTW